MSEQDRPPPTKHAFDRGVAAGRDAERAAVVAWLRANTCGCYDFAAVIEKGEHRKEEP